MTDRIETFCVVDAVVCCCCGCATADQTERLMADCLAHLFSFKYNLEQRMLCVCFSTWFVVLCANRRQKNSKFHIERPQVFERLSKWMIYQKKSIKYVHMKWTGGNVQCKECWGSICTRSSWVKDNSIQNAANIVRVRVCAAASCGVAFSRLVVVVVIVGVLCVINNNQQV